MLNIGTQNLEKYHLGFTVYEVKAGIETNQQDLLTDIQTELPKIFPVEMKESDFEASERRFAIKSDELNGYTIEIDGKDDFVTHDRKLGLAVFFSHLRVKIAEYAESFVFLHAGVVGWKGSAIVIPGESFSGKSTLVAELVKLGADYYSDEYAVIDKDGLVHPFPKMLSIRGISDSTQQKNVSPTEYGNIGIDPIPVGLVLITGFEKDADWDPIECSPANGVMEILSHCIPIRYNPKFSLFVLNKLVSRAIITKSKRTEAAEFAPALIEYFEKNRNTTL